MWLQNIHCVWMRVHMTIHHSLINHQKESLFPFHSWNDLEAQKSYLAYSKLCRSYKKWSLEFKPDPICPILEPLPGLPHRKHQLRSLVNSRRYTPCHWTLGAVGYYNSWRDINWHLLPHKGNWWQTKIWIPPKSDLVNQWVLLESLT